MIDVFSSAQGNSIRLSRETWTKWLNGGYALHKYSAVLSDVQIQGRRIKFRIKITQEHLQDQPPGAPTPLGLAGGYNCDYDLVLSEDGKKLHGTASIHDVWNRWHVVEHDTTKDWELARHD